MSAEPDDRPADKPPRPYDIAQAIRVGGGTHLGHDLHYRLMAGRWSSVLGAIGAVYLALNLAFAGLYLLDPEGVTELGGGSFLDAFAFSVQTFTTVGYGRMAPVSAFAQVVALVEATVGLFFAALATGLVFAKATRPRSGVVFSEVALVETRHGKPTLTFRAANARGNDIVEASVRVAVLKDEVSPEGHALRRVRDLALERSSTPLFALTWQVFHVIDEASPLYGLGPDTLPTGIAGMICTLTGHDATFSQTTYHRKFYTTDRILWGRRFVDVIERLPDGRLRVDYSRVHDTRPVEGGQPP